MQISIIGGDARFVYTALRLRNQGCDVLLCGAARLQCDIRRCDLNEALMSDAIILPLPVSRDGKTVNAPYYDESITLDSIISRLDGEQLLLGGLGKIDYPNYADYYNNEDFLYKNSVVTAEGAVQVAMANTVRTLWKNRCLVVGYGRLGKVLCNRLSAFGCQLTASARKASDFELIAAAGYTPADTGKLEEIINDFDVIFNTVPYQVITAQVLEKANPEALFIELASAPYGIDFSAAEKSGLKVLKENSLPSRAAPKTAGEIIADTVLDIIHNRRQPRL